MVKHKSSPFLNSLPLSCILSIPPFFPISFICLYIPLGQFWNIPIHVTPFHFTGPVNYDLQNQELYLVEVEPKNSDTRRFVAEYYPRSWDPNRPEPCLYAGDQQGGRILEIKYPNDPVIENNYRLYNAQSLFGTSFRFSQFESSQCDG